MKTFKYALTAIALFSGVAFASGTSFGLTNSKGAEAWLSKDYHTAYHYFNENATHGDLHAADRLASLYYFGQGVKQDYQQAFKWYKQASNTLTSSKYMIAHMYLKGEGVAKNVTLAQAQLAELATTKSFPKSETAKWVMLARRDLGDMLSAESKAEAFAWYSLVAAHGDEYSNQHRVDLWQKMNVQERESALKLSKDYASTYAI